MMAVNIVLLVLGNQGHQELVAGPCEEPFLTAQKLNLQLYHHQLQKFPVQQEGIMIQTMHPAQMDLFSMDVQICKLCIFKAQLQLVLSLFVDVKKKKKLYSTRKFLQGIKLLGTVNLLNILFFPLDQKLILMLLQDVT